MKAIIIKMGKNEVIRYLFFGGLTTVVSLVTYALAVYLIAGGTEPGQIQVQISNVISWVFAVSFAYITNKLFVFNSKSADIKTVMREMVSFVSARVFSLGVEAGWLWISVEIMTMNNMLAKFIGQFVVVVINYFFSKLFIFKKSKDGGREIEGE